MTTKKLIKDDFHIPAILPVHPDNYATLKTILEQPEFEPDQVIYNRFANDPGLMADIYLFQTTYFMESLKRFTADSTKIPIKGCFPGGACPEIKNSYEKCSFIWSSKIMFQSFGVQKVTKWMMDRLDTTESIQSIPKSLEYMTLLNHSLQVAWASKCIAEHINLSDHQIETVRLCGLLHDIGKFVSLCPVNQKITGTSWQHQESGALLAKTWVFPEVLHQTLLNHHRPSKALKYKKEVSIVFMANFLILDFKDLDWKNLFNPFLLNITGIDKQDIINLRLKIFSGLNEITL